MSVLRISTDEDQTWFKPAGVLLGSVRWHLDRAADAVELRLFWFTRGRGTQDVQVVDLLRFEEPQPSEERRFRFVLPDRPYSFSGRLVTLAWALELVVLPEDEVERLDILVGPRPAEVSLGPV
jgi:hypothetical protein